MLTDVRMLLLKERLEGYGQVLPNPRPELLRLFLFSLWNPKGAERPEDFQAHQVSHQVHAVPPARRPRTVAVVAQKVRHECPQMFFALFFVPFGK